MSEINGSNHEGATAVTYGDSDYPDDYFGGVFILAVVCAWTLMFAAEALVWRCQEYLATYNERAVLRMAKANREKYIKNQLITKRVISCISCPTNSSSLKIRKVSETLTKRIDTNPDDLPTCQICIEPYQVDERVSWSKSCSCNHHFHHDCVVPWLIMHDECPNCRANYIHKDYNEKDDKCNKPELVFCAEHGLVSKSFCGLSNEPCSSKLAP